MADAIRKVFGEVAVISLRKRADRRRALACQLKACQWPFVPPAFHWATPAAKAPPPAGWREKHPASYAATMSHLQVLQRALKNHQRGRLTLVLEDDCVFPASFTPLFKRFMNEVPDDWDALMLGYYYSGHAPMQVSPNVAVARHFWGMHCYCVREPLLSEFIGALKENKVSVDGTFSSLMYKRNVYVPWPEPLALQAAGFSDVALAKRTNAKAGE